MIQFYKNQIVRCELEVKHHEREADNYDTKAADEMMTGTSAQAQEYADIATVCRAEAVLAQREVDNYTDAITNWNN
tara:strand:- start:5942 stop:6169 length:228 start_codon:yes stop_codon:yes gene_type:complete